MSKIGAPERVTQNRVAKLFHEELGYDNAQAIALLTGTSKGTTAATRELRAIAKDVTDEALEGYGAEPVRTILPTLVITPTGVGLEIDDQE